eukprot:TRINITY_DN34645_c0_g1_i1.p1 TRINITY_DN34645_c0_g1~~TRINITY_DN34645_c0_g1_i1.p1  ORF type:complete len:392 (-),score=120.00 TRINITY_DN34645_c0_g1_i1:139-1314(-)
MSGIADRVIQLGLDLNQEALQALSTLPQDHALELLDATATKAASGTMKSVSNYVCATIARGYVSRADGSSKGAGKGPIGPSGRPLSGAEYEAAAAALIATPGMQKAEQVGLQLTDEAVQSLLRLPAAHASELLEVVATKSTTAGLKDPSNYVIATIARGYQPRGAGGPAMGGFGGGFGGGDMFGGQPAGGKGSGVGRQSGLIPPDCTQVESAVLELNEADYFGGQPLSVSTMLTLRCIPQNQAMEMLNSLAAKGMGKGAKGIRDVNSYLQAAVAKIVREGGGKGTMAGGKGADKKNFTGNQSKQKAASLGLTLTDETMAIIARMPLKSANSLMEKAAIAQGQGQDANLFIQLEGGSMAASADEHGIIAGKGQPATAPAIGEERAFKRSRFE